GAVGIDIEGLRPVGGAEGVAARGFPRRESRAYAALAPAQRAAGFFRGWTRTEALAKALGTGLVAAREALDAALDAGWVVHDFEPRAGFCGALAYFEAAPCR